MVNNDDPTTDHRPARAASLTWLLALLLVVAGVLALVAYSAMSGGRDNAQRAQADLAVCSDDLADLAAWGATSSPLSSDGPALSAPLSQAAGDAGIAGRLASVEPGQPTTIRDSDYTQVPVFVRLNSVSLRQMLTFLHHVCGANSAVRAKTIELSPDPAPPKSADDELWTADITLAYLSYTPREKPR